MEHFLFFRTDFVHLLVASPACPSLTINHSSAELVALSPEDSDEFHFGY